jgi:muconolactone D-isomerase
MLFMVKMILTVPTHIPDEQFQTMREAEREYARDKQRAGTWVHLWRIAGKHGNYSVFDVSSNDELNDILWGLPLFEYIDFEISPLAKHRSILED